MRSVFFVLLAVALVPVNVGAAPSTAEKSTAKQISTHIQKSGQLRNYRIGVTYKNGTASLAGTVTSEEQRDAAIRLAKEVKGVNQVECKLECTDAKKIAVANTDGQQLTNAFAQTAPNAVEKPAAFRGDQSGVVQAYAGERGLIEPTQRRQQPQQQAQHQMLARTSPPANRQRMMPRNNMPLGAPRPIMDPNIRQASAQNCYQAGGPHAEGYATMGPGGPGGMGGPMPTGVVPTGYGRGPSYENAHMPGYAWPSYASYPNYAALSYPQQYSPTAWPYIGPFYPYPQVPLAWRKVSLEWDDGWWFLDFSAHNSSH